MSHLTVEALARLVDERAAASEAEHLATCPRCAAELEALRDQSTALRALPALEPPATAWPALEARLAREGLIRTSAPRRAAGLLRLAAALALLLTGGVLGAVFQARQTAEPGLAADGAARQPVEDEVLVERLRATEQAYLAALASYNEALGVPPASDPIARLAALEGIVLTTSAALDQAPADPVINGYHLTALAQRDATLRGLVVAGARPAF
ncbi:MAG: hypothetical protein ACRELD_14580 [Longimicrobiales bacterium]